MNKVTVSPIVGCRVTGHEKEHAHPPLLRLQAALVVKEPRHVDGSPLVQETRVHGEREVGEHERDHEEHLPRAHAGAVVSSALRSLWSA